MLEVWNIAHYPIFTFLQLSRSLTPVSLLIWCEFRFKTLETSHLRSNLGRMFSWNVLIKVFLLRRIPFRLSDHCPFLVTEGVFIYIFSLSEIKSQTAQLPR